jgi:hypothetical protein
VLNEQEQQIEGNLMDVVDEIPIENMDNVDHVSMAKFHLANIKKITIKTN